MPQRKIHAVRAAVSLVLAVLLSGCSFVNTGDIETLLRAPQLSSRANAVQKALNNELGVSANLKYPASGDFLSPFLFGDLDGDGTEEAAVLYTLDATGGNVWLAVLEPTDDGGWRVTQTAEGLSGEVESVNYAHLRDAQSQQILVGYGSAQGDQYMVVYLYSDETLQVIIQQSYTEMILADLTGGEGTQDLILALPTETENGGVNLQLLTNTEDGFRSAQTLAVGDGIYNGCAALHAGTAGENGSYLVVDGWAGASGNTLASSIILYDPETQFLKTYLPPGTPDFYHATLRYDSALLSTDLDGNGTIDIPCTVDDGGEIASPMDKRLRFLLWRDYAGEDVSASSFGVYDSEYRFFLKLPESLHGSILLRTNRDGNGWLVCNQEGTTVYCELRVTDPSQEDSEDEKTQKEEEVFHRVATIGSQQLQARIVTPYYGLGLDDIINGTTVFR
ncbi:MAG: hypothetical protein U0L91_07865 [Gemmiger sp.]|uniref:hypothetical protein n=1 Tax=Gemmiger sp. TaxID=2049027 RepID=UPI002E79A2A2|nr:hypothetical protein [Gemmiger sp.]MEE0801175.1 hypothetical protein [Gemmiger sp.]